MKANPEITLQNVQTVYSGPEGDLWELVMGEQIHIGGLSSSADLAQRAGIAPGSEGVDLCCCTGAGMRFLVRLRGVARMLGVDATPTVIERGRSRVADEGLADRIEFVHSDVCRTPLPDALADFAWGEDAWCYVVDKPALLREAVRLTRPGGTIAFTDWVIGPQGLSDDEAARFLAFMKFPNLLTIDEYAALLTKNGCEVREASDTHRFAPHADLYINMLSMQLTYDALKIIGFDMARLGAMAGEMDFLRQLAHDGKIAQGRFIATRR